MTSAELRPGVLVDDVVRLVRLLGEGGMGSVWVADHLRLGTQVAVKFLAPALAKEAGPIVRFQHEAMLAAQIKSPHVVQVFDQGVFAGERPYIVMELLEGEDLSRRLARAGPLGAAELTRVVVQVCRALGKAHAAGVVHRDIKPDNVFLTDHDGETFAKVLDFGIAKRTDATASMVVTDAGSMVGTPYYMSPEQMLDLKHVDFRADLWSLGVVAYHCLTGRVPFEGRTIGALCVAIEKGRFEPPSRLRADLPPAVDAWFVRALDREPAARFDSAREMADALVAATGGPSAEVLVTSTGWRSASEVAPLAPALASARSAALAATPSGARGAALAGGALAARWGAAIDEAVTVRAGPPSGATAAGASLVDAIEATLAAASPGRPASTPEAASPGRAASTAEAASPGRAASTPEAAFDDWFKAASAVDSKTPPAVSTSSGPDDAPPAAASSPPAEATTPLAVSPPGGPVSAAKRAPDVAAAPPDDEAPLDDAQLLARALPGGRTMRRAAARWGALGVGLLVAATGALALVDASRAGRGPFAAFGREANATPPAAGAPLVESAALASSIAGATPAAPSARPSRSAPASAPRRAPPVPPSRAGTAPSALAAPASPNAPARSAAATPRPGRPARATPSMPPAWPDKTEFGTEAPIAGAAGASPTFSSGPPSAPAGAAGSAAPAEQLPFL